MKLRVMCLVLATAACAASVRGATYYIDAQTGDDANDGLSWDTAWRNLDAGTPTLSFQTNNPSGSSYLLVSKHDTWKNLTDVGGFPESGKLAVIDPFTSSEPQVLSYSAISTQAHYRFDLTAPLANDVPKNCFVYRHPDSGGPFTPGGSVANGYGFQPGDLIWVRGTFTNRSANTLAVAFCNQFPASGERVTYRAADPGAKLTHGSGSGRCPWTFIRCHSFAFEGIEVSSPGGQGALLNIAAVGGGPGVARRIPGEASNILFKSCSFNSSLQLSFAVLPSADWIGNEFHVFAKGPGDNAKPVYMAYPGYRVANNRFHNMYLTNWPAVSAFGAAGNPAYVENNTFFKLGTNNTSIAVGASNAYVVIRNNIFDHISGTAIIAPDGTPADYNLFYACSTNYSGGFAGGSNDIAGPDPLFVSTNYAMNPWPIYLTNFPDLHVLSPRGYTTNNAGGVYLYDYKGPISPAVDAGDPTCEYANETEPNRKRINIGAYGNTPESAISPLYSRTVFTLQ